MKKRKLFMSILLILAMTASSVLGETVKEKKLVLLIGSSQMIFNGSVSLIDENSPEVSPEILDGKAYVSKEVLEKKFNIKIQNTVVKSLENSDYNFVPIREVAEKYSLSIYFSDGIIVLTNNLKSTAPTKNEIASFKAKLWALPKVNTKANLSKLLDINENGPEFVLDRVVILEDSKFLSKEEAGGSLNNELQAPNGSEFAASAPMESEAAASGLGGASEKSDFSETNTQVKGVDEGDIIKTDGKYIFYGRENNVNIVKATPAKEMQVLSTIQYDNDSYIIEMFLNNHQLIVITSSYDYSDLENAVSKDVRILDYGYYRGKSVVKTYIYDITDIKKPKEEKVVEIDGEYSTARKVNNELYFITNSYVNYNYGTKEYALPVLKDSVTKKTTTIGYNNISYFPESISYNLTNIIGIKLDDLKSAPSIETYLGNCESVYMSQENLYISATSYNYNFSYVTPTSYSNTNIYKFALDKGKITYSGKGRVDGTVLNQFSMDENNGYFRIATTTRLSSGGSTNSLFVLDKTLNKVGEVNNIAQGEQIFSVRFMGNKAYMVTFELTDPLFVIDLTNPKKPAILGELKIPGYSQYLHPYDDNHLIGFGIDTEVKNNRAVNKGMKISMFDVSDLSNPKEKFTTVIGDIGTTSELLYNHRALLFDKEKNVMAFPVQVNTNKNNNYKFEFQGAFVYSIDMTKGFVLRDSITHIENNNIYDYNAYVNRIIYIGDNLYTVSNAKIKANSLTDMKEIGVVGLE